MVNELGKLLHDNVAAPPPDDVVDVSAVVRAGSRRVRARRRGIIGGTALLVAGVIGAAAVVGGLGSDEQTPADPPEGPTSVISDAQAGQIKARMSPDRVRALLGEPLLTQAPFGGFSGGCVYYAMEDSEPANVWQFCSNDEGVNLVLTAFSPSQPPPPEDASYARGALIARADSVCQSEYGHLAGITDAVGTALTDFTASANQANTDKLVRAIGSFVANLETTHSALAAFTPPDDKRETYQRYVEALAGQIGALSEARQAIADLDFEAYDEHGTEFNEIGDKARAAAADYGFTTCSAPEWG